MSAPYRLLPDDAHLDLTDYTAEGGGAGLRRSLAMAPAAVVEEVRASGLRGRGGAGFRTGVKWASVVAAAGEDDEIAVVCNGAEGEPGTYKDRPLLERAPHQLLEGLLIALHATGANRGIVATKARFTDAAERLETAREELVDAGWEGADRVEVVLGPDEYLFGEESALLEVIEGKLPMPRILPPYQQGLASSTAAANPAIVNNVETLSHVARILSDGGAAFRSVGTEETPGTMVFTVLGDVARPGFHELPMGTPLRALVEDLAGAQDVQAVVSGVSNTIITPDLLDLPMDFDSFAEAGVGLGSGGFIVYDASRDMVQVLATLARFLAIESCGQCNACKLGTGDMSERLDRLVAGRGTMGDVREIGKRTLAVTDGNRCYLPVGAALLIRSALQEYPESFASRVRSPSPPEVAVAVPKIIDMDVASGTVVVDGEYHRKRADWSYAPADDRDGDAGR